MKTITSGLYIGFKRLIRNKCIACPTDHNSLRGTKGFLLECERRGVIIDRGKSGRGGGTFAGHHRAERSPPFASHRNSIIVKNIVILENELCASHRFLLSFGYGNHNSIDFNYEIHGSWVKLKYSTLNVG